MNASVSERRVGIVVTILNSNETIQSVYLFCIRIGI